MIEYMWETKRTDRADRLAVAEAETPKENVRENARTGEPAREENSAEAENENGREKTNTSLRQVPLEGFRLWAEVQGELHRAAVVGRAPIPEGSAEELMACGRN